MESKMIDQFQNFLENQDNNKINNQLKFFMNQSKSQSRQIKMDQKRMSMP